MNLDEDKLYIKIVALDVIYNFVVNNLLICVGAKNMSMR